MIDDRSLVAAVFETATAYQRPAVLAAACRLGLFDAFADEPASLTTLAEATGAMPGALAVLLDALAGAGFVTASPAGYAATAEVRARLGSSGDLALIVHKEALFARAWTDLDASIRTGVPRLAPWGERLETEPDVARGFLEALVVIASETGPDLTRIPELASASRVLDAGGGLGSYARPLAAAGCAVTLVDLPVVASWAAAALADVGGIEVVAADLLAGPAVPGARYDAALVSHLLHDLPDDAALVALRSVVAAVRPGGYVVVVEIPGDVGPGTFGALFDLMMRVETPGRARHAAEVVELMGAAGLTKVRRGPYSEPIVVLVGEKR